MGAGASVSDEAELSTFKEMRAKFEASPRTISLIVGHEEIRAKFEASLPLSSCYQYEYERYSIYIGTTAFSTAATLYYRRVLVLVVYRRSAGVPCSPIPGSKPRSNYLGRGRRFESQSQGILFYNSRGRKSARA